MEVITMRKFLTQKNQKVLARALKNYLLNVLKEEEHLNTLKKCYKDAERVKCYGNHTTLTVKDVDDWLRGLPLSTAYMTYNICKMLFSFVGLDYDVDADRFREDSYDLDCYYWHILAIWIYSSRYE